MRTVIMSIVCSVLFAGVIVQAEEPSAQLTPPIFAKTAPKSGNENIDTAATNDGNFQKKYNEWKTLMEGKNGMPKDEAKAGQILTQLIKGVYLVKFGPGDRFSPQSPGEYIPVFFQTSSLRSGKDGRLGIGFLRTKRENNKLTASFLTDQPDQMKKDIEKNPKLVFVSMEEMTTEKFISYDKSVQESLRNEPMTKSGSPAVANSVLMSDDSTISFLCRVQAETEVFYEIHIDGKVVGSGNAIPNSKNKMTHILSATPGDHAVTITAPGYETWRKTVTLSADSKIGQNILAELKKPTK